MLDPPPPASSWSAGQEEERAKSRQGPTAHQTASLKKPLLTPFISKCRGNCVCCKYRARTSAQATIRCDSRKTKTQTFSKREQISSSVPHECPASVQSVTRVYPTPCHAGRGLAGHPRSVRLGYGDNKTRLFTPIHSKTPAFQRRGLHLGAGRERSRSTLRGDDVVGKRSHRKGSSSSERVRLLQPLLPRPQKGWRPPAHPRSLRSEVMTLLEKGAIEKVPPAQSESGFYSHYFLVPKKDGGLRPILDLRRLNHALMRRSFRMITLKQILSQIRTGDWFCSLDLKDAYFHIQIQTILEIRLRGSGFSVHGVLPFGLSLAPRTFTKCMDAALSPLRQMGIHLQERHRSPTQSVSENAGPHGRSIVSATAGPASQAAPPTLVETTGSTQRMASRTPAHQGEPGLCDSPGPLEEPTINGEGRGHGNGLQ